ncbi:MAG TPA: hypothetical protein VH500_06440 [Nitrososphaeraceae archaeon]|jgi:hypothetical protein
MEKGWCPTVFVPNLVDWGIEDPKGKSIEKIREIRDEIQERVRGLIASLPKENYPIYDTYFLTHRSRPDYLLFLRI